MATANTTAALTHTLQRHAQRVVREQLGLTVCVLATILIGVFVRTSSELMVAGRGSVTVDFPRIDSLQINPFKAFVATPNTNEAILRWFKLENVLLIALLCAPLPPNSLYAVVLFIHLVRINVFDHTIKCSLVTTSFCRNLIPIGSKDFSPIDIRLFCAIVVKVVKNAFVH